MRDPSAPIPTGGGHVLNRGLLWFMRLGIVAMLTITAVVMYSRYHQSPEQVELVRYVENELPALDLYEGPIVARLQQLLADKGKSPEAARRELVDELMPALVRLRKLAEAPLRAATTPPVQQLAEEYRASVDAFIDACRTALHVIDDPKLDAQVGASQVQAAFARAAERSQAWRSHVAETTARLRLLKRQS
ncbi:MAG: hypothetical protein KA244_10715 [Deltaproteobacteria bacterium]|nr:hypothetical protein [Deltaproteobacteria bacterium]